MFRAIDEAEVQTLKDAFEAEPLRSIYEPKLQLGTPPWDTAPRYVYFYYLDYVGSQPRVRRHEHDHGAAIPYAQSEGVIIDLARKIRSGQLSPVVGQISGSVWTRKSYIAILMDDPYYKLHRFAPTNRGAVIFSSDAAYTVNHSFFDGRDITIDMLGNAQSLRSCVYFVNHMKKNDDGDDITYDNGQPHRQTFKFDILYDVTLVGGGTTIMRDDPTGTNQGPPS